MRWANHQEFTDGTEEIQRARASAVVEILDLSFEDITAFYFGPEDAEPLNKQVFDDA